MSKVFESLGPEQTREQICVLVFWKNKTLAPMYTQGDYSCVKYHVNNTLLLLLGDSVASKWNTLMLIFLCINLIFPF